MVIKTDGVPKISAILRGEEDVNRRNLKRIGLRYKPHEETICPLSGVPGAFDALGKYDAQTAKEQWEALKSYYFESIKKHPKTKVVSPSRHRVVLSWSD